MQRQKEESQTVRRALESQLEAMSSHMSETTLRLAQLDEELSQSRAQLQIAASSFDSASTSSLPVGPLPLQVPVPAASGRSGKKKLGYS